MGLPRGMRDMRGEELAKIRRITEKFGEMAESYGYAPVDPSPLELLSTLETKTGPSIRDDIYAFTDRGGREVGLRFDFTMGLTRDMAQDRSRPLPSKVYGSGGVFRYDEPQKARYRYFHQWDIEIYGKPHIYQDVEVVEFTAALFRSLDIRSTIRLSHRAVAESVISHIFGGSGAVPDMLRAADKIRKKPSDVIVDEFAGKGYDPEKVREVVRMAGVRGTPDYIASRDLAGMDHNAWDHTCNMWDHIRGLGVSNIEVDLGVVRGLDYYTGMVFEVFGDSDAALAGGGRYDDLPGAMGSPNLGAAGAAGGIERMAMVMAGQPPLPRPIPILYVGPDMYGDAARLAGALRQSGVPAHMDLAGRSFKRQMEGAADHPHIVIVAPREMRDGAVIIRDMVSRSEQNVPYDILAGDPRRFIPETPG